MPDETPFNSPFDSEEESFDESESELLEQYVTKLEEHFSETSIGVESGGNAPFDPVAILNFPSQSDTHQVSIEDTEDADTVLAAEPPSHLIFFDNFLGYYDPNKKRTLFAARIISKNTIITTRKIEQILANFDNELDESNKTIKIYSSDQSKTIILRTPNQLQRVLLGNRFNVLLIGVYDNEFDASEKSVDLVANLVDSLLLQIEATTNIPFKKISKGLRSGGVSTNLDTENLNRTTLDFPRYSYPKDSYDLYSYAIESFNTPILQFLAFYQSIEARFKEYSNIAAQSILRSELMNPSFRIENKESIYRLTQRLSKYVGRADEKSQLFSVIEHCIDSQELADFINNNTHMRHHLTKSKVIPAKQLNVNSGNLVQEATSRIYDIRCMIVHAKEEDFDGQFRILPNSERAQHLYHDINFIWWIARQVVGKSGRSIDTRR